ncbi:MAG: DUF4235 domain-containing protein [Frankiales bacterium]|nr:DUF4235 domain-containing protein [Frankiales bacterium]
MAKQQKEGGAGYKVMALVASVLGALVARKTLAFTWKAVAGKEPPANPEHPAVTWPEAVSWAVISGAVVGVARMVAQKKVAASWHRSTGSLPPGLEETAA